MGKWVDFGYNHLYGIGCVQNFVKALDCFRKGAWEELQ